MLKKILFFKVLFIFGLVNIAQAKENNEIFDLHFVVITPNPAAHVAVTIEQLKKEVDILNTYFVTENRSPIVKFRFKSAASYDEIKNSSCAFVALNGGRNVYNSDIWAKYFNQCDDSKVKDPHAINVYIYDSYTLKQGFKNRDGHGKRNLNQPFIFLDWERINHGVQAPEEHEMGHAFGLSHVCSLGVTSTSSTNIMSGSCTGGYIGKRDIGFNPDQVNTIMHYVPLIKNKLKD